MPLPLTKQHQYGSGEISLARFLPGTQTPGARRYLGNTPEFTLSSEREELKHFDVDHGTRVQDDSVITQLTQTGNVVTDNISFENLAMLLLGTTSVVTTAAATGTIENITSVQHGTYQMGITNLMPTGIRMISGVPVVTAPGGTPIYTAGTDYLVDAAAGTVTFVGGAITEGLPVRITYNVAASSRSMVVGSNMTIEGALHFKSFNAVGPKVDYYMPWVKFSPNGDFSPKSEEWITIPFSVEVLKRGNLATVYADGQAVTG